MKAGVAMRFCASLSAERERRAAIYMSIRAEETVLGASTFAWIWGNGAMCSNTR